MNKEIFVAGAVKHKNLQRLREKVISTLEEEEGINVYRNPTLTRPYTKKEHLAAVQGMEAALRESDLVIWLPEMMGVNTAYELGMAVALNKPIVALVESKPPTFKPESSLDSLLNSIPIIHSLDGLVPTLHQIGKHQADS